MPENMQSNTRLRYYHLRVWDGRSNWPNVCSHGSRDGLLVPAEQNHWTNSWAFVGTHFPTTSPTEIIWVTSKKFTSKINTLEQTIFPFICLTPQCGPHNWNLFVSPLITKAFHCLQRGICDWTEVCCRSFWHSHDVSSCRRGVLSFQNQTHWSVADMNSSEVESP